MTQRTTQRMITVNSAELAPKPVVESHDTPARLTRRGRLVRGGAILAGVALTAGVAINALQTRAEDKPAEKVNATVFFGDGINTIHAASEVISSRLENSAIDSRELVSEFVEANDISNGDQDPTIVHPSQTLTIQIDRTPATDALMAAQEAGPIEDPVNASIHIEPIAPAN